MAEKTEAPTPRRRDEARAKGQGIGRSWEFSMGLTLGVGTLALSSLLPGMAATLVAKTQYAILTLDPRASNARLVGDTGGAILTVLILILPLACLIMVAGIAGNLVSGGLVLSLKAVRFDLSRINPISGMKRMADKQMLVRLGLATTKLVILAFISYQVVGSRIPTIVGTEGSDISAIAGSCLSAIFQLGLTITILLAIVALVDFVVQRRKAQQSIRMTKEEVKQEYKEQEGDPQIRGARRRRARQMAFARMMDAVPTADVIVTNPTTLAVALKYDSLTMRAPRIVAKGQRLMAERIKQLARESRVPIVEDKPLARALFSRPIGAEVPAHLYRAVAKLLVLVHQARFNAAGRGGRGAGRNGSGNGNGNGNGNGAGSAGRGGPVRRAGAANGMLTRPWWAEAAASVGQAVPTEDLATDAGQEILTGTSRIGGATGGAPTDGADDESPDADWLDEASADDEPVPETDAETLARAMAEDELADLTAEELALFEAERDGPARTVNSIDPIDPAADRPLDPSEELER
jgi:flagellar biosynthetic protein FlhB